MAKSKKNTNKYFKKKAKSLNIYFKYQTILIYFKLTAFLWQDRKSAPRVPISAADVARLLEIMGVDRVIAVDLHCGQIQGFFGPRVPVDNLEANIAAVTYFGKYGQLGDKLTVVSPDAGGVARAKKFQELIRTEYDDKKSIGLAMIIKHRDAPGKISEMYLVGNVQDTDVIIVDDIIDTAVMRVGWGKLLC